MGDHMRLRGVRSGTEGHVATLTLDRPSAGNTIDKGMAAALREACDGVTQDDEVWVVVITGAGHAFCRGTDAGALERSKGHPETLDSLRVSDQIAAIEVPVIAALNGDAVDQGLELALACDIRIVSRDARLGLRQVEAGLIPWDGGTQRLSRLVGLGRALELVLTGRLASEEEAFRMGLVNNVVEPGHTLDMAKELALTIAGHGPIAARYVKEAMLQGVDLSLDQGLRMEADLSILLHSSADRSKGIRSFIEGRAPKYRGE